MRVQHLPVAACALAATVALAACGGDDGDTGDSARGGTEYGVVMLTAQHPFYQAYQRHWEKLGGAGTSVLDSETKAEKQQSNVESLLSKGVDAIALSPVDAASAVPVLRQAKDAGASVVTVAVETPEAPVVVEGAYEGGRQGGVAAAEWVKENHPDWDVRMGIVAFPQFQQTVDRARGFVDGVKSVIKDAKVATEQDGGAVLDKATQTAENMIQAHPEANVWFGINDDSALGALRALKAAGRGTTETDLVVGFDGSAPALQELLDEQSALKVEVGNLPLSYARTAKSVLEEQRAGRDVPQVNPVPVKLLTSDMSRAEIEKYYSTEYGGSLE
jgi:ribose transport system substrate-binding protein